jgi:uncharacterized lipoprotein YddW (UPF0748 family)
MFTRFIARAVLLLFVLSLASVCRLAARDTTESLEKTRCAGELRAVWASTLSPCLNTPDEIHDLVAAVRKAHLNTVIAQVRHRSITYFRSEIEPPAPSWAGRADFDPLATLIREAHETTAPHARLDVYAWFNVFNFGNADNTSLSLEQRARIKSWLSYTTTGTRTGFLDPAIPDVQEYLLSLIRECVEKYPVDGVNLDFIRYPEEEAGYHPVAIARFQKLYQRSDRPTPTDPEWNQFRRDQITAFVRRCAAAVWKVRPDAVVSVCAVGFGGAPPKGDFTRSSPYRQVHQDWAGWAREGCVDIVTRMGYKREHIPAHAQQFREWADFSRKLQDECHGPLITLGIGGFFNTPDNVIAQYREAMRRSLGTSIFSYWRPESGADSSGKCGAQNPLWERLGKEVYQEWCSPPRPEWRREKAVVAVHCVRKNGESVQPVDGTTVTLHGTVERVLRTDGNGWAVFVALPSGRYTVAAEGSPQSISVPLPKGKVEEVQMTLPN